MAAVSTRLAQRSGFGIVIGLLAVSMLMAWGIQESFSERSFAIHRQFVQEQDLLTNVRRIIWSVGIAVRDYYLDPAPGHDDLDRKIAHLAASAKKYVGELRQITRRRSEVTELDIRLQHLLDKARMADDEPWDTARRFHFLQQEIIPARDMASQLLRDIEKANHSNLTDSEEELRDTRQGAATRLLVVLGACLLSGFVIATLTIRRSEELEQEAARRFREILGAKQQLEELSARLMEVQEEERTKLSRELHDEIVQNLAVLKMEIVEAQNRVSGRLPEAREPLARARRLAEDTVRSVRDISLLLRPSLLDDLGLGPALQWQTEEFARRTGTACRFEEVNLSGELPEAVKTCVYRVTQEALRNCEKHSGATQVTVRVRQTSTLLEVVVTDNGNGFSQASRKPSNLGVLGMRERAFALGGSIEISNLPEGGAMVRMTIPLSEADMAVARAGTNGALHEYQNSARG